ncbi:hypothetical protein BKA70DRAFT_1234296 [Coprinopsis sp. MPI-PUGE-AT-0042]|nr:hypothetical protein BKA70DRAFT_1234296 [Coprinopsis sp. MPI-PUGE-AT-0042]
MPTISSTDKVLVTGANGYIGLWIVKTLLERGNPIKLELAIVPDITEEGAFDNAVNGVQASCTLLPSLISPTQAKAPKERHQEDRDHHEHGSWSPGAPLTPSAPAPPPKDYLERGFLKIVEEKVTKRVLCTSIVLQRFLQSELPGTLSRSTRMKISWDLTTIVPPLCVWRESIVLFFKTSLHLRLTMPVPPAWRFQLNRDGKAGGERILVVAEAVVWQDFDLSRDLPFVVDTKKSKESLGLTYRSKEERSRIIFDDLPRGGFYVFNSSPFTQNFQAVDYEPLRHDPMHSCARSKSVSRAFVLKPIKETFKSYGDRLELTIVPDITTEFVHTATAIDFPTLNQTQNDHNHFRRNDVKRIVITTCLAAVASAPDASIPLPPPEHLNKAALEIVEEKGAEAGALQIYSASKVLAERALLESPPTYTRNSTIPNRCSEWVDHLPSPSPPHHRLIMAIACAWGSHLT